MWTSLFPGSSLECVTLRIMISVVVWLADHRENFPFGGTYVAIDLLQQSIFVLQMVNVSDEERPWLNG